MRDAQGTHRNARQTRILSLPKSGGKAAGSGLRGTLVQLRIHEDSAGRTAGVDRRLLLRRGLGVAAWPRSAAPAGRLRLLGLRRRHVVQQRRQELWTLTYRLSWVENVEFAGA